MLQDAVSVLGIAVLSALEDKSVCEQAVSTACCGNKTVCDFIASGCQMIANPDHDNEQECMNMCDFITATEVEARESKCNSAPGCVFVPSDGSSVAVSMLILLAKLAAVIVILLILARFVLKPLFEKFAGSLELLYFGSMGYCVGLAGIAASANFSGEITAFLAGVSLTHLPYKLHIVGKMEPVKSLGVAIFFIALGLETKLDDTFVKAIPAGVVLALVSIASTLPLFMVLGYIARVKAHNTFMIGTLMSQISEFSLILCSLCKQANVFEDQVLTVFTVAAIISIVVSSIGHQQVDPLWRFVQQTVLFKKLEARYRRGHSRHQSIDSMATGGRRSTRLTASQLMEAGIRGDRAVDALFSLEAARTIRGTMLTPPPPGLMEDWEAEEETFADFRLRN